MNNSEINQMISDEKLVGYHQNIVKIVVALVSNPDYTRQISLNELKYNTVKLARDIVDEIDEITP
jgi:hypothetical protein